jgi:hypothetical protein
MYELDNKNLIFFEFYSIYSKLLLNVIENITHLVPTK